MGTQMRLVQISLLLLIILLQYRYWFSENGYFDKRRLDAEIARQQAELSALTIKDQRLQARVDDLKSSNDAIEELARQNLGLIKPDEIFIMIRDE